MTDQYGMYIGGEHRNGSSKSFFEVIDPATGAVIAEVADGTADDIDDAVAAARHAYQSEWQQWAAKERSEKLHEMAAAVREAHDSLVELETSENGKPLHESDRDVTAAANKLEYYAGAADKHHGETLPDRRELFDMTVYEPYGVVGIIIPWNWPPMHVCDFIAPALAAGNTVVLKPAPETPLSALHLADIFDDLLPAGVVNVVTGGVEPGAALTAHPDVDLLSFTGNSKTGEKVLEAASKNITPAVLELGGKNAAIVFDDADLEIVVPGLVDGAFFNTGEACSSAERILVQESIHDEFIDRFVEAATDVTVGEGTNPEAVIGPLVSQKEYEKVVEYIDVAQTEGAELVYAGETPDEPHLADGFFVAPHVFDGVTADMRLFNEEVFGPVVAVTQFETEAEAVRLSNSVEYGLTGAVFTENARRSMRVARDLETGTVYVNNYSRGGLAPFGGYKRSGIGRKNAFMETMSEFSQVKTIRFNMGSSVTTIE